MREVSVFISKKKAVKLISKSRRNCGKKKNIIENLSKVIAQKIRKDEKNKRIKNVKKEALRSVKSCESALASKNVTLPLSLPIVVYRGIVKISDTYKCTPETYIVKVLREEIDGKHLSLCGGLRKTLK